MLENPITPTFLGTCKADFSGSHTAEAHNKLIVTEASVCMRAGRPPPYTTDALKEMGGAWGRDTHLHSLTFLEKADAISIVYIKVDVISIGYIKTEVISIVYIEVLRIEKSLFTTNEIRSVRIRMIFSSLFIEQCWLCC